jgi:hypothetical protein
VHRNFLSVARRAGLFKPGDGLRPRLHDLRHHFCIETMLRWYRLGRTSMLACRQLSTYMGHGHVEGTSVGIFYTRKQIMEMDVFFIILTRFVTDVCIASNTAEGLKKNVESSQNATDFFTLCADYRF